MIEHMNDSRSDFVDRPAWERPGRFERAADGRGGPGAASTPTGRDGVAPPGWPHGVRPPGTDDWQETAVAWLLDLCPPGYRRHEVLRRHPALLARLARHQVEAALHAARHGYGTARADLRDHADPHVIESVMRVYEYEGSRTATLEREVHLIEQALQGKRWNPRL